MTLTKRQIDLIKTEFRTRINEIHRLENASNHENCNELNLNKDFLNFLTATFGFASDFLKL